MLRADTHVINSKLHPCKIQKHHSHRSVYLTVLQSSIVKVNIFCV